MGSPRKRPKKSSGILGKIGQAARDHESLSAGAEPVDTSGSSTW
jgi:hypothetical protein